MTLSIIIPNYNHGHLLPRCLSAIERQTVKPLEVIVVDDASTDESLETILRLKRQSPLNIILHEHCINRGTPDAIRSGLAFASGDYVAFPAADDEITDERWIETADRMLSRYPQTVFSGLCQWSENGLNWTQGRQMPKVRIPVRWKANEVGALLNRGWLHVSGQHAIYPRQAAKDLLNNHATVFEDWWLTTVLPLRHGLCWCPRVLSRFNLNRRSWYNRIPFQTRREAARKMLTALLSPDMADVLPTIRDSGMLADCGLAMVWEIATNQRRFWNGRLTRRSIKRAMEWGGRRLLPKVVKRELLRRFYR